MKSGEELSKGYETRQKVWTDTGFGGDGEMRK